MNYDLNDLKVWWKPNMVKAEFEFTVKSLFQGYLCTQLLAYMDLTPNYQGKFVNFVNTSNIDLKTSLDLVKGLEGPYKDFRRSQGFNHPDLIEMNIGGLLVWNSEDEEYEDWIDDNFGDNIETVAETLIERGVNVQGYFDQVQKGLTPNFF